MGKLVLFFDVVKNLQSGVIIIAELPNKLSPCPLVCYSTLKEEEVNVDFNKFTKNIVLIQCVKSQSHDMLIYWWPVCVCCTQALSTTTSNASVLQSVKWCRRINTQWDRTATLHRHLLRLVLPACWMLKLLHCSMNLYIAYLRVYNLFGSSILMHRDDQLCVVVNMWLLFRELNAMY